MPSAPARQIAERDSRVLVVDDSAVVRAVLARALAAAPGFTLAGAVGDVRQALAFLERERVDAILLDLEMPGISGLAALPDLIAAGRGARVLVVSSACDEGASATVQALALGAADTLAKPAAGALAGRFAEALVEKLTRLADRAPPSLAGDSPVEATIRVAGPPVDIVAIGASTGGIHALGHVLRALPATFDLPILITQHLPAAFSPYFAAQVAVLAGRPCEVASDRMRVRSGAVIVAPGDAHMVAVSLGDGTAAMRLSREPATSGCMPSVDPMLASLAQVYGSRLMAVVLSGMGRDGSEGARIVREAGGAIVVQDQATSVVWGMPGSIAALGIADAVLPPEAIGRVVAGRRRPA